MLELEVPIQGRRSDVRGSGVEETQQTELELWTLYEKSKAEIVNIGLSPAEYYYACQRIADELGL